MINREKDLPELPKGWAWTTVGDISLIVTKGSTPTSYGFTYTDRGINFIKVENIRNGKVDRASISEFISEDAHEFLRRSQLSENDVLFSIAGTIGRVAIVQHEDLPANTNQAIALIRCPWQFISPNYIENVLRSAMARSSIEKRPRGIGMNNVSLGDVNNIMLPLAPLPEQHRIVAKIEELFTKVDAGVDALKRVKAQLARYRQSVLKHAFEGKLTEEWREAHKGELEPASALLERIREERQATAKGKKKEVPPLDASDLPELPRGWAWTRVREIGQVETGATPSKSETQYYGRDYPFYKPTDLNAGYYTMESQDGLTQEGTKKARLLPEKSILVTCIGATIGKTGFIRQEGASNQQINAIIPHKDILPEYIYFICISPQFQKSILGNASATTLPILSKRKFEILSLPLAPVPEEHRIVEETERHLSIAEEVEKVVDRSLQRAERLRQSILKRAFEGKLVAQDPSDEPATELLERIREERAKLRPNEKNHKRGKSRQLRLV